MPRTRPTKIRISLSQLYRKLRSIHKKVSFHDTQVQLIQNVHQFASCAVGQIMLHSSVLCPSSAIAKNMVKSMVSVLFKGLCSLDLKPRMSRMCTTQLVYSCPWNILCRLFFHHVYLAERKPSTHQIWYFHCTLRTYMQNSSNCAQIHALCTGNKDFLTQKFDLSKMCTTQFGVR